MRRMIFHWMNFQSKKSNQFSLATRYIATIIRTLINVRQPDSEVLIFIVSPHCGNFASQDTRTHWMGSRKMEWKRIAVEVIKYSQAIFARGYGYSRHIFNTTNIDKDGFYCRTIRSTAVTKTYLLIVRIAILFLFSFRLWSQSIPNQWCGWLLPSLTYVRLRFIRIIIYECVRMAGG